MFVEKQIKTKNELLRPDEHLLLVIKKHWLAFLPPLIMSAFFIIGIFMLFSFLVGYFKIPPTNFIFGILVILKGILSLGVAYVGLLGWLKEYYDLGFVTNKRIIDVDQVGLFSQEISEMTLDKIQDVSAKKHGILQTYLDYGDVLIQTAGELPNFEFINVPRPYFITQKISEVLEEARQSGEANE